MGCPAVVQAKDLAVACPRRRPEAFGIRNPLAIKLLAGFRIITRYDATALPQNVKVALINQWRGLFRTALGLGPCDSRVGSFIFFQSQITRRSGPHGIESAACSSRSAAETPTAFARTLAA